ncbi:radical SAM protein [candidate division WOR-3 bacterium]|nr:radical SAM protein [candidate division WOR-3 bacterium]
MKIRTLNNLKYEEFDPGLKKSFAIRMKNFQPDIFFFAPTLKRYETTEFSNSQDPVFVPISLTGPTCPLNCKHCGGKLLESMYWAYSEEELYNLVQKLNKQGIKGLLITGGSCVDGTVPMKPFLPILRKIKEEMKLKLAAHTGIVDKQTAMQMNGIFDVAMMDIIGRDETISEIYNLDKTTEDFYNSIEYLLEQGIAVAPHIVLGLHYGKILGEFDAIKRLTSYNLSSLVLVIVEKLKGTVFYKMKVKPPTLDEIKEIFIFTRKSFPKIPILVGCARPGGAMEKQIDITAIMSGFNGIAYPSEVAIAFSKKIGLHLRFSEYCCSFLFQLM